MFFERKNKNATHKCVTKEASIKLASFFVGVPVSYYEIILIIYAPVGWGTLQAATTDLPI